MKKNVLKSGLLALALTLLTSAVDATNPTTNDSNKRELILSVLDQSKPNQYVPAAFFLLLNTSWVPRLYKIISISSVPQIWTS